MFTHWGIASTASVHHPCFFPHPHPHPLPPSPCTVHQSLPTSATSPTLLLHRYAARLGQAFSCTYRVLKGFEYHPPTAEEQQLIAWNPPATQGTTSADAAATDTTSQGGAKPTATATAAGSVRAASGPVSTASAAAVTQAASANGASIKHTASSGALSVDSANSDPAMVGSAP